MPDMLSMHFRYANKLSQSKPNTPERSALSDIVRWISEGRRDADNLSNARVNVATLVSLLSPTPEDGELRERVAALKAVYDEFLAYTSSL